MQKNNLYYKIERLKLYLRQLVQWLMFDDENEIIHRDFLNAVRGIQYKNYREIVFNKLAPYIKETTLKSQGYLITEKQALEGAQRLFLDGRQSGKIDFLNALVMDEGGSNGK